VRAQIRLKRRDDDDGIAEMTALNWIN